MEMEKMREEKRKTEQRLVQMEEEQQRQRERLALEAAKQSAVCACHEVAFFSCTHCVKSSHQLLAFAANNSPLVLLPSYWHIFQLENAMTFYKKVELQKL
jgi:hypothetical protein